jgi:hypothetical protein
MLNSRDNVIDNPKKRKIVLTNKYDLCDLVTLKTLNMVGKIKVIIKA